MNMEKKAAVFEDEEMSVRPSWLFKCIPPFDFHSITLYLHSSELIFCEL